VSSEDEYQTTLMSDVQDEPDPPPAIREFQVGPDVVLFLSDQGDFRGGKVRTTGRPRPTERMRVPGTGEPLALSKRPLGNSVRVWFDVEGRVAAAQVD